MGLSPSQHSENGTHYYDRLNPGIIEARPATAVRVDWRFGEDRYIMPRTLKRTWWLWLSIYLIAACSRPPPETVVSPEPVRMEPPPPTIPRVAVAKWTFSAEEDCVASATSMIMSVSIAATDARIIWTIRRKPPLSGPRLSQVAFSGPTASWAASGHRGTQGQVAIVYPISEYQAARILVMLNGGTFKVGVSDSATTVRLPNAGLSGKKWFECVRHHLQP